MPTVLIVDDEEMIRINLECFLEDEGFTVFSADSGEAALKFLSEHPCDIAVVDMRLPGIDGNSVILKAHRLYPNMRFLIHTGSSEYSLPDSLLSVGLKAEHILLKPLADMQVLLHAIETL